MGLRELARLVHLSAGHLHNWEVGIRVPKESEVGALAGCLRLTVEERERLVLMARHAREPNWLENVVPGAPPLAVTYAEYERTATAIFNWQLNLVPGLLQTGEYARVILDNRRISRDELDVRILTRVARRELLRGPVEFTALIGASALYNEVGGKATMIGQLRHLIEMASRRNVTLRIVPERVGYHRGLLGCFVILDFENLPAIVHAEQLGGGTYSSEVAEVAAHREVAKTLLSLALDEAASIRLVEKVLAELTAELPTAEL